MSHSKYITLNDQMKIPTLGIGTWKIPNNDAPLVIEKALGCGLRLIDTAAVYGNEEGVGLGIKQSLLKREEVFLTTKLWNTDHGYDSTLRAMDHSLNKLKTDYVDLYLIHWPKVNSEKFIPTWKAMVRLRQEGLARSIGVSNFNSTQIERLIQETGVKPAINQIELHPYFQQAQLRDFHSSNNIITQSWSPLARGKLLEDETLNLLSKKYKKTVSQIILRWHYELGIIAIPKTTNIHRMVENSAIFDFRLSEEDMLKLKGLDKADGRTGPDPLTADF